jgi:peptide/nickel transport system substrate-binding protein
MKKRLITLAVLGMTAVLLAACATGATPAPEGTAVSPTAAPTATQLLTETPTGPVTLRVGTTFEPNSFSPFLTSVGWAFADLIGEGFTGYGLDCKISPRLAESMERSDDGLTWTIHLRPGITYNDGQPLDANVLVKSWDWISTVQAKDWFPPTRLAVSWKAVDDLTFQFTTSSPLGSFATYDSVWQWPFPPQVWGSTNDDTMWNVETDTNPVGTGPYTLTEWKHGEYLIYDARNDYYLGKPPVDRVIMQVFANWDAVINAFLGGDIDMTDSDVPAQYFDTLKNTPNVTVVERPPAFSFQLAFNLKEGGTKNPAIEDPKVREAIDYAIDRQQIVDLVLLGHGVTCANTWNCGSIYQWAIDPSLTVTPFDPDKARSILDEAGYADSDGNGVREGADGKDLNFRLYYQADKADQITVSDMISKWLSQIGIATSVEAVEPGTLQDLIKQRDFDIALRLRAADPDPAITDYIWTCSAGSSNASGYCNPAVDDLIAKSDAAIGQDRLPPLFEAERIFANDRAVLLLAGVNAVQAYRNDRFVFPDNPCNHLGMEWNWTPIMQAQPVQQ